MRISIICFSLTGYMTAEDLQKVVRTQDVQTFGKAERLKSYRTHFPNDRF